MLDEDLGFFILEGKVIKLTNAEAKTLAILLEIPNKPKDIHFLSERLFYSENTIRRSIAQLNKKIKPFFKIINKFKFGYSLSI